MYSIKEMKMELKKETDKHPEKYYPIEVLKEKGFIRNKCKICGKSFWSMSQEDVCGEPECAGGYKFIRNPVGKAIDFIDVWKNFSYFFSKRGYSPIKRYPVAARWREDTDFVQASIYDFQPYVVNGEISPPANPLVVPQYCVRFNSIDSVGITGRHNTGFVMIGQHAFFPENKFDKPKYFRDLFDWLTDEVKIPKFELKIIENVWGGGGNLGVCLEFFARGLELANQVYMLYKITPRGYENLNLRVLDMGMGQDRVSWLTKGTTTIYEVDYPPVCEKLYKKTGVYPNEIYEKFIPYGSFLDVDSGFQLNKMWLEIANSMNIDIKDLRSRVLPLSDLYSLADHTQTLLIAIGDGVLPSNIGGGYNLRIILRRCLRILEKYGWNIELIDICKWHAEYLRPQYPEVIENLDELQEILDHEISKYKKTQQNAKKEILRMIEKKVQPTDKDLYTLYESKGILPETVKNIFEEHGKSINIPPDFYSKLASLHMRENIVMAKEEIAVEDKIKDIKDTAILYYEPIYEFSATVLKSWSENGRHFCILDRTAFYPKSGGQDSDTGKIDDCNVIKVEKYGNIIVHETSQEISGGKQVHCVIDRKRRELLSKLHTATHIINAAAVELLGKHVWQAGSELTSERGRLDITHFERLSDSEMDKLNELANQIVREGRKVLKKIMKRNIAEELYGFRIYQGGAVPSKELRIIEIENFDAEACAGTHVDNTFDIEEILIYKNYKIQDGVLRLEFVAGKELCEKIRREFREKKIKEEERILRKIRAAKEKKETMKKVKEKIKEVGIAPNTVVYLPNKDFDEIKSIGKALVADNSDKFLILISEGIVFAISGEKCNIDVEPAVKKIAELFGGGYGKKGHEFSGGGPLKDKTKEAYEIAKEIIRNLKENYEKITRENKM